MAHRDDERRKRESQRILRDVDRDSQTAAGSPINRIVDNARAHFGAADADSGDAIDVLGKRIGRALALVFFVVLVIYLVVTYILP